MTKVLRGGSARRTERPGRRRQRGPPKGRRGAVRRPSPVGARDKALPLGFERGSPGWWVLRKQSLSRNKLSPRRQSRPGVVSRSLCSVIRSKAGHRQAAETHSLTMLPDYRGGAKADAVRLRAGRWWPRSRRRPLGQSPGEPARLAGGFFMRRPARVPAGPPWHRGPRRRPRRPSSPRTRATRS